MNDLARDIEHTDIMAAIAEIEAEGEPAGDGSNRGGREGGNDGRRGGLGVGICFCFHRQRV